MDPYLEGRLWPDVHRSLAMEIRRRLVPLIRPRYVARLEIEIYVVLDESPELAIGILYPDVEVLPPVEFRCVSVEIRETARNELVTTIEVLSPVNKREPGLTKHREKREKLHLAGVHLLEIDLLRRGTRPLAGHPRLPATPYLVTLTRAREARAREARIGVWPVKLEEALPVVPVPLRHPDPDVTVDLSACLRAVYDQAGYDLSIDYAKDPPPPPLSEAQQVWLRDVTARPRGGA